VDLAVAPAMTDNGATVGAVTKNGNGALRLGGANTYTGPTTVNGGTLEISGSISGITTAPTTVNSGTLKLSATNAVNNAALSLTLGNSANATSGTLKMADTLSGASEMFGVLNVDFNATIDFGALAGNSLMFTGVGDHTFGSSTLSIQNWSGTPLQSGNASTDRLIFSGSVASFTSVYGQQDVSFNGVGGYGTIDLGAGQFEVVAIPEPTPVALNLAAGLVGLFGFRRWRRLAVR
jgi:autotransporter-associated beta strand protein